MNTDKPLETASSKIIKKKNPHDKKGRSTSCLLCQKRKQKCDHRLPSCTTCIKAGVECIQPLKYSVKTPEKDEYTQMLEKKVKFLEKLIENNNIQLESKNKKSSFKYKKLSPFITDISQIENSLITKFQLQDFLNNIDPIYEIDLELSKSFIDLFFTKLQFKYPLLDENEIYEFYNNQYQNNHHHQNNNVQPEDNSSDFLYNYARLYLIFAIGSNIFTSTNKYSGPNSSRYFSTSLRYLIKCENQLSSYQQIEILDLLVLYLIRTDYDASLLFEIIKNSLNLAINMKLNRFLTYQSLQFHEREKLLRIWWCTYLLERMISISVGKPYSIPEYQIDKDIPLLLKPFIVQSIKLSKIESNFVEFFKLSSMKQISDHNLLIPLKDYFQKLSDWRSKIENLSPLEMETLTLYYFKSIRLLINPFLEILDSNEKLFEECQAAAGQICQLFKKFNEISINGHSTTAIHTVFSAGVTLIYCLWIQRNKDDAKRKALGDVSKHTRPRVSKSLFNSMNDLRACSICLFVMKERSENALIFRNIFDQLMYATIANLIERCGEDSSEIFYNNNPGIPPAIVRKYQSYNKLTDNGLKGVNSSTDTNNLFHNNKHVPKSLSHLLINSTEFNKLQSNDYQNIAPSPSPALLSTSVSKPTSTSTSTSTFTSISTPTSTSQLSLTSNTVDSPSIQSSKLPEYKLSNLNYPWTPNSLLSTSSLVLDNLNYTSSLFLNIRTNTMISNISNWTDEAVNFPTNNATDKKMFNDKSNSSINYHNQHESQHYNSLNGAVEEFWKYGNNGIGKVINPNGINI
ncbi:hypothetical protein WICMUC_001628 [Wickerhamomyces mucosus]|uniref:Zn(2)-C6 fungal-type domain-containing protein n=1 Tax=Wickerhamomyces mucosus TaxID=1378264 RepID=A0A9P8TGR7_9ASCO|nr:hypothetical protein WICMUC_001628 [Wickerhamomyces mucosus]